MGALDRVVEDRVLAEGLRRCLEVVVTGGLERSCLMGSVLGAAFETRFDVDLCSPLVIGLLVLGRDGGSLADTLLAVLLA